MSTPVTAGPELRPYLDDPLIQVGVTLGSQGWLVKADEGSVAQAVLVWYAFVVMVVSCIELHLFLRGSSSLVMLLSNALERRLAR